MPLDTSKLVNFKPSGGGKATAQCPACAAAGSDLHGRSHLVVFNSGAYGCAVDSSSEHRKAIWKLAGLGTSGEYDPDTMYVPTEEPPPEIPQTWPLSVLDRLIKDHSYWEGRGISAEIMEGFKGGMATDGKMKGRYVIPIIGPNDRIIGFNGRRTDGGKAMKWKILGSSSKFLWGGLDAVESSRRAILVESMGDALALMQNGVEDVVVLFGVNISQVVLGFLISSNVSKIIVATNNDTTHAVGQNAASKISSVLSKFFNPESVVIGLPIQKDFGDMSSEEFSQWKSEFLV